MLRGQPRAQRLELAGADLGVEIGEVAARGGEELGAHDVAERIALERAADDAAVPVDVLQRAVAIVGRRDARGRC